MGSDFGGGPARRNWFAEYARSRRTSRNKSVIVGSLVGLTVVAALFYAVTRPQTVTLTLTAEPLALQSYPPETVPADAPRDEPRKVTGKVAPEAVASTSPAGAPSGGTPVLGSRARPYLIPPPQQRDRGKPTDREGHALFHGLGKNQSPPKVEAPPLPPADEAGQAGPAKSGMEGTR